MKTVEGGDRSPPHTHTHTLLNSTALLSSCQEKLWQVCFIFNVFLVYTITAGLLGVMHSSSRLSGRVQQPLLVESRGSRRYYFSPVPGFLADSFSSTTSLQPRGLTAGQTPTSCSFSVIYTQRAEPAYTLQTRRTFQTHQANLTQISPSSSACRATVSQEEFTSSAVGDCGAEKQSVRQWLRPFLLTGCSLGLAFSEINGVWQPFMTKHT